MLELVEALLIRVSSDELLLLLSLAARELKLRGDRCAHNHVVRAIASHRAWVAEEPTRRGPVAQVYVDSGDADQG